MTPDRAASRASAIAGVALVAVLVAASPPAGVEGNKAKTKITLGKIGAAGASGKVSSKRAGCEPGRKVTLFVYDDFVTDKVKITQSNAHGKWHVHKGLGARQVLRQGRRGQGRRHPLPLRRLEEPAHLDPAPALKRLSVSTRFRWVLHGDRRRRRGGGIYERRKDSSKRGSP